MASVEVWTPVLKPASEMASLPMNMGMGQPSMHMLPPMEPVMEEVSAPPPPVVLPPPPPRRKQEIVVTPEEEQMQKVVSRLADDNPASVAEIIQLWLNEDKTRNV